MDVRKTTPRTLKSEIRELLMATEEEEKEKKEIIVPWSSRAEKALVLPLLKRFDLHPIHLVPGDFLMSFIMMYNYLMTHEVAYVFLMGDRLEVTAAGFAAFHLSVPIIHMHGGVKNIITTLDDINRHVLTLWSDIQIVESRKAKRNVKKLCKAIGKEPNVYIGGITHLDDIIMDYSKVPKVPYNIILYNPTTRTNEVLNIVIGPNEDTKWYNNLPREQFLGLLEKCDRFISNSSSTIYEAPYFLKKRQIVNLGERNKNRTKCKAKNGGADKIANILYFNTRSDDKFEDER